MLESGAFAGTPQLDYETWRALVRSEYGDENVSEPNVFAAWRRPLSVCGFIAAATRIECGVTGLGNAYQIGRTQRDVRRAGLEDYRAVFQAAGRSMMNQNDEAVELAAGDVALVDMGRPWTFSGNRSARWLFLQLPRRRLISHLGFEPQGGLRGRGGTLARRLLYEVVKDGVENQASLSAPAGAFMQLAVYDLLGALFAPSDPIPRHTDKLFVRVCGIIRDRFADPELGPCEVAAEAGISLRYLQKLFMARGSTCTHFIHALRLQHAAGLLHRRALLDTGQPLGEIAYACGFHDYSHFARKFRDRFGCLPAAYAAGHGRSAGSLKKPDELS